MTWPNRICLMLLAVQFVCVSAQLWMLSDMRRMNRNAAFNICVNQSMVEIQAGVHARSCRR